MERLTPLPWPSMQIPTYRETRQGRWHLREVKPPRFVPGYYSISVGVEDAPSWALCERNPTTRRYRTWMSLTPMELESHQMHLAEAEGHVVVAGLGMGMFLYNLCLKPEVTSIDLIECNDIVMKLFTEYGGKRWPGIEKVTFWPNDARVWRPDRPVDFLYADIWPLVGDSQALPETKLMQENIQARKVGYWTQELDFSEYVMRRKIERPTTEHYAAWVASTGLPLIGGAYKQYPRLALAASLVQGMSKFRSEGHAPLAKLASDMIEKLVAV